MLRTVFFVVDILTVCRHCCKTMEPRKKTFRSKLNLHIQVFRSDSYQMISTLQNLQLTRTFALISKAAIGLVQDKMMLKRSSTNIKLLCHVVVTWEPVRKWTVDEFNWMQKLSLPRQSCAQRSREWAMRDCPRSNRHPRSDSRTSLRWSGAQCLHCDRQTTPTQSMSTWLSNTHTRRKPSLAITSLPLSDKT